MSEIAGIPLPSGMGKDRRSPAERGPCSAEIGRSVKIIWARPIDMRSNNNVTFDCTYHVVWCPKYRRVVKQYLENQKNV